MKRKILNGTFIAWLVIINVSCNNPVINNNTNKTANNTNKTGPSIIVKIANSGFVTADIVLLNDKLYFTGRDSATNLEQVFCVDTQGNNLSNLSNFIHSDNLADIRIVKLLSFNNKLYLQAYSRDKSQQNSVSTQMYVSDGTSDFQVLTGIPNTNVQSFVDGYYTIYKDKLYYFYYVNWGINANAVFQLWSSDGTQGGASMLMQFTTSSPRSSNPLGYHNAVYFAATDAAHGEGLWAANQSGVCSFIKGLSWPNSFFAFNDKLNFYDGNGVLMMSDGTLAGTHPWQDNTNATYKALLQPTIFKNKVYFFDFNHDLCSFDGSVVTKIKNISVGPQAPISAIAGCGDKVFFTVKNSTSSTVDLWASDGTSNGTTLFKTLNTASTNTTGLITHLTVGSKLYFTATTEQSISNSDLWVIDADNNYTLSKPLPYQFQGFMDQKAIIINNAVFAFCRYNNSAFQLYKLTL